MKKIKGLLLFVLLFLFACRNESETSTPPIDPTVTLHFVNAKLSTVIYAIKKQVDCNIFFCTEDVDSFGEKITINVENLSFDSILNQIQAKEKKLEFSIYGKVVKIVPAYSGKVISLNFVNSELMPVLDAIEKQRGFSFCYCPDIIDSLGKKITIKCEKVSPEIAIRFIARREKKLYFDIKGKSVVISSQAYQREMNLRTKRGHKDTSFSNSGRSLVGGLISGLN